MSAPAAGRQAELAFIEAAGLTALMRSRTYVLDQISAGRVKPLRLGNPAEAGPQQSSKEM